MKARTVTMWAAILKFDVSELIDPDSLAHLRRDSRKKFVQSWPEHRRHLGEKQIKNKDVRFARVRIEEVK